jgi:hypothetical protein
MGEDEVQKWTNAFGNRWKEELASVWHSQSSIIRTLKE